MLQVLLDRQQRGKGQCRYPTGWMLGGEHIWCGSHLWPNQPPETSNWLGHLYHHICLCLPVWLPWCRKRQFLWQALPNSCRNSYLRDYHPLWWLERTFLSSCLVVYSTGLLVDYRVEVVVRVLRRSGGGGIKVPFNVRLEGCRRVQLHRSGW